MLGLSSVYGIAAANIGSAAALGIFALARRKHQKNKNGTEIEFITKQNGDIIEGELWSARNLLAAVADVVQCGRPMLQMSLRCDGDPGAGQFDFTDEQTYIRDLFGNFFDRLGRFERYIRSDVVSFEQLKPYFLFWGELMTCQRSKLLDCDTCVQIWKFLRYCGCVDAEAFLLRFGKCPLLGDAD